MYSALVIASKFIQLGIQKGKPVNPMKLQKMVYFAHGLHLARNNKPLINEEIEAWSYGPVIPSIYHEVKQFGNNEIEENVLDYRLRNLDSDAEHTINLTWEVTKNMSAVQLSNWSHIDGSPWEKTYDGEKHKVIPNEVIKEYFSKAIV